MMRTTAILVCLLLTVALPVALADVSATDPTTASASGSSCVTVNPDPTHPIDIGSCPAVEEGSNIP